MINKSLTNFFATFLIYARLYIVNKTKDKRQKYKIKVNIKFPGEKNGGQGSQKI
jgi:hypothetical protein